MAPTLVFRGTADNKNNIVMPRVLFLTVVVLVAGLASRPSAQPRAQTPASPGPGATARAASPTPPPTHVLPGTRPEAFTTIQGNALNASSGALTNSVVRLRDARYGRIVATTVTDKSGLFAFRSVDPGSYIVELIGPGQTVLAASQILDVNAGDAVSAVVKVPFSSPPFGGVLGHSATSAALVVATAAASGVLATQVAGEQQSPRR